MRSNFPAIMIECLESLEVVKRLDLAALSDAELMTLVSELAALSQALEVARSRLLAIALARGVGARQLRAAA